MSNTTNLTITVPADSYIVGNQLCTPVSWTSLLTFFLTNYVAHVGTVPSYPGERGLKRYIALITALLFPTAGAARGLDRIVRCAVRGKKELTKAARAGALLMVIRSQEWRPADRDVLVDVAESLPFPGKYHKRSLKGAKAWLEYYTGRALGRDPQWLEKWTAKTSFGDSSNLYKPVALRCREHDRDSIRDMVIYIYRDLWTRHAGSNWTYLGVEDAYAGGVHRNFRGTAALTRGYKLAYVPHDAVVEELDPSMHSKNGLEVSRPEDVLRSSYDFTAGLSSIIQLLFGIYTLYGAVGPQIERFGYAAFGLTVLPYTLMSLLNLLGSIATPSYDSLYLVDSEILQEAYGRGARFKGVVGRLVRSVEPGDRAYKIGYRRTFQLPIVSTPPPPERTSYAAARLASHQQLATARRFCYDGSQPGAASTISPQAVCYSQFNDSAFRALQRLSIQAVDFTDPETQFAPRPLHHVTSYTIGGAEVFLRHQYSLIQTAGQECADLAISNLDRGDSSIEPGVICVPSHPSIVRSHGAKTQLGGDMARQYICLIGALPLLPWGILTHFRSADSTLAERVCTMLWLSLGIFIGWAIATSDGAVEELDSVSPCSSEQAAAAWELGHTFGVMLVLIPFCASPIAGFVQVGLMYAAFGSCIALS